MALCNATSSHHFISCHELTESFLIFLFWVIKTNLLHVDHLRLSFFPCVWSRFSNVSSLELMNWHHTLYCCLYFIYPRYSSTFGILMCACNVLFILLLLLLYVNAIFQHFIIAIVFHRTPDACTLYTLWAAYMILSFLGNCVITSMFFGVVS